MPTGNELINQTEQLNSILFKVFMRSTLGTEGKISVIEIPSEPSLRPGYTLKVKINVTNSLGFSREMSVTVLITSGAAGTLDGSLDPAVWNLINKILQVEAEV